MIESRNGASRLISRYIAFSFFLDYIFLRVRLNNNSVRSQLSIRSDLEFDRWPV